MLKPLLVVALGMSLAGAAHADCTLSGGPAIPYDYFNRSPAPKIEESAITCQQAMDAINYYEDNFGDPGTVAKHSVNWSWLGFGCNAQGSGLPLGYAAEKLTISGCPSGLLCKIGGNNVCIPY